MTLTYRKANRLELRNGIYVVRLKVPEDVQAALGKKVFSRSLGTGHERNALNASKPILANWQTLIKAARQGVDPQAIAKAARDWKASQDVNPEGRVSRAEILHRWGLEPQAPDLKLSRAVDLDFSPSALQGFAELAKALRKALDSGEAMDGLDRLLATLQVPETPAARAIASKAILEIEAVRLNTGEAAHRAAEVRAALGRAATAQAGSLAMQHAALGRAASSQPSPPPAVLTGHRISEVYRHWVSHHPTSAKNRTKQDSYVRRLQEFMGEDVDVGLITKVKAGDFWLAIKKFPARRNSAALAKMDFNGLVSTGLQPIGDAALFQWSIFLKSLFKHAEEFDFASINPFSVVKHKHDKSGLEGEFYTAQEVSKFFSLPLFTGHAGDYDRILPGPHIVRDWRYWLPILSLWSGTRLNEWAAADSSEIIEIDGDWFLNLTERPVGGEEFNRVKTKAAKRLVPIHEKLIKLGLLEQLGQGPIFPDLHDHKMNPGSRAANWFTRHRGKAHWQKTLHELRHTWKNAARATEMSEEISDLISAHASGSIGRKYGAGLKPETITPAMRTALTTAMGMIEFPTFPLPDL